jgi:Carboxypeptidase regulatory-like domain
MRPPELIQFLALATLISLAGVAEGGQAVISGTVRLIGSPPATPPANAYADSDDYRNRAQSLLLGTNQSVREAIVYLDGLAVGGANSETNNMVILDQRNNEFIPRIQIARSGAPLILRNSDSFLHVVRIDSMSGTNDSRRLLQVATPYAGYEKKFQLANFGQPTLLRVTSANGQGWMAAFIAVMPHPWATLTDENGRFVLRNVPAGKHKIYAWHEVLGTLVREVQVNGARTDTVDFQFSTKR